MSNKKLNEELQSRREFFKKAAKAALPVVGAVVMSSLPFAKAEAAKTGCDYNCSGSCYRQCDAHCQDSCYRSCYTSCDNSCHITCLQSCYHGCSNTCRVTSR